MANRSLPRQTTPRQAEPCRTPSKLLMTQTNEPEGGRRSGPFSPAVPRLALPHLAMHHRTAPDQSRPRLADLK